MREGMPRALPPSSVRHRVSTSDHLAPGTRIGDYVVDHALSIGDAPVAVYLGTHVVLPRRVALKVMQGGQYLKTVAVQMLREACLLEAIAHPAVPRLFECGVLADKRPWMALEYIDGTPLADLVTTGPMPLADLVAVLRDAADLLRHAHARAVVHRNLTTDAIVSTPGRTASSVCIRHWDSALTLDTQSLVGLDARDDIYALGAIAYRALTGEDPRGAASAMGRCPSAPTELTQLVDRMLAVNPTSRPVAAEVAERARWLATTVSQSAVPAWVPPRIDTDAITPLVEDPGSGFVVRISRSGTR